MKKTNLKPINWLLKHALTVGISVLIVTLGTILLTRSSPGPTTIGENITTGNLTATGTISEGGSLLSEKYADKSNPLLVPTVTSIEPDSEESGYDAFTVTITGTGFSKTGMSAKVGDDTDLTDVNVSSLTSLTATVPTGLGAGIYDVEVSNLYFQHGTGSGLFTFTPDITPPEIASAVADSSANYYQVTFNEAVDMNLSAVPITFAKSALNYENWTVNDTPLTSDDTFVEVSSTVVKITPDTPVAVIGTPYTICCININDLFGNAIISESCFSGDTSP